MESALITFPIISDRLVFDTPGYLSIFGFKVYLYGLFITAGFALAAIYLSRRHKMLGLATDNVLDLVILAVPCGLIGARLYYAIFNASYYFGPGNWLNIFRFREGGLAVYGGVIGGVLAFIIYGKIKKIPIPRLFDAGAFGLFIGQAVGRWGNFFNREAFGSETTVPWKMGLTTAAGTIYVHPTFLYESLWNIIGFILLHNFSKKRKVRFDGQCFLFYAIWYGFGRFIIESYRTDSLFIAATGIRASQLLAALSFTVAVVLMIRNYINKTRTVDGEDSPLSDESGDSLICDPTELNELSEAITD